MILYNQNLNYSLRKPSQSPSIKPAYEGGNKVIRLEDLKSTPKDFVFSFSTFEETLLNAVNS